MLVAVKSSDRNLLTGATSGLSVRLSAGELDPREPLREIRRTLARRRLDPAQRAYLEGVRRQLVFREFARSALPVQGFRFPPGALGKESAGYRRLVSGRSGIPLVDAAWRDLNDGLPHNRARLLLARYAIRNLNIDPEEVARLLRQRLRDYSPVINTFNIVSAASGAVFAEPWFRLSNPVTAARSLDPDGTYRARFGFADEKPTAGGLRSIQDGSRLWILRWKSLAGGEKREPRRLWATRDRERGLYFILDRLPARGAFAHYYRKYLEREDVLLHS